MRVLATIGYERATLDDVIGRLKRAGVEIVLDVRAVAASRRAGFSKTLLSGSLKAAGIDYLHLRALGTPKPGRQAARAGRIQEMHRTSRRTCRNPRRSSSSRRRPRSPPKGPRPCCVSKPRPRTATAPSSRA